MREQLFEPRLSLVLIAHDLLEGGPVLASQLAQELASRPHPSKPLGILVDTFGSVAHLVGNIAQLGGDRRQAPCEITIRSTLVERSHSRGDGIGRTAVGGERRARRRARLAMHAGVSQRVFLGIESVVLVGILDRGMTKLGDLKPVEVDLAGPRPFVAAEVDEGRLDRS